MTWAKSQLYAGNSVRFRGGQPNDLRCCDCGLVHTITASRTVTIRFDENARATAGSRNGKRWRRVGAAVRASKKALTDGKGIE